MALSNAVRAAVLAEIAANGLEETTQQIRDVYITTKMTSAQTAIGAAVTMSVADWAAVDAFMASGVSATALYPIRAAIAAKIAAKDVAGLGVLLLTFFAADKAHRG